METLVEMVRIARDAMMLALRMGDKETAAQWGRSYYRYASYLEALLEEDEVR